MVRIQVKLSVKAEHKITTMMENFAAIFRNPIDLYPHSFP